MSRTIRDSHTPTAEPRDPTSTAIASADLTGPPESEWIRSQLPLLYRILDQLDGEELTPRQRVRALRSLKRPLLEMVRVLSRPDAREPDPKVSALEPSPTSAQRLIERMCRNLDHLLLTLDRRRYQASPADQVDRRWTIRQLFVFLGHQIELGVLRARPWPPGTWQRLHDLFEYLIERQGLQVGRCDAMLGRGFHPEIAYKRLLLLGLFPPFKGAEQLEDVVANRLTPWAAQSRLAAPEGHLGEYGLIVVETSRDGPPRYRERPVNDPWRGWVLEPPGEFLDFAGIRRPALSLAAPRDEACILFGARR